MGILSEKESKELMDAIKRWEEGEKKEQSRKFLKIII